MNALVRLLLDPAVRQAEVLETALRWQTGWPAAWLVGVLGAAVLLAIVVHRSSHVPLSRPWRIVSAMLRCLALGVAVWMLARPTLSVRLERREPNVLAVMVDESQSMAVRDGPEPEPTSRWQRAVGACGTVMREWLAARRGAATPAGYVFGGAAEATDLAELAARRPEERRTDVAGALRAVNTALADRPTAGVLILSDGADNGGGDPVATAAELARWGRPVYACLVGEDRPRDVRVTATAEAPFAFAGDPVPVQVRVQAQGFGGRTVSVTLREGDKLLSSKDVALPADDEPAVERFEVVPDAAGRRRYSMSVEPLPGEVTTGNNTASFEVQVTADPIRVLYVERWPRWQYRFLRQALLRDPRFATQAVLLTEDLASLDSDERRAAALPSRPEQLRDYDVVVLGEIAPEDLSASQLEWIADHVAKAGAGAVFIAGARHMPVSFLQSPIASLLPFERASASPEGAERSFRPRTTRLGALHPLMRLGFGEDPQRIWDTLPPLEWMVDVSRLKPGAVVLAERADPASPADARPLVILQRVGRGSTVFVATDETWRWRYKVGNQYFYGFWSQVLQHVGMPHRIGEFRDVRIEPPGPTVPSDVPVSVSVAIEQEQFRDDADATLVLMAQRDGAAAPTPTVLTRATDYPFVYEGQVRFAGAGRYRLWVEGREDRGDAIVDAESIDPETARTEVDGELLRRVAAAGGGRFLKLRDLPAFLESWSIEPLRYRWTQEIELWDNGLTLALLTIVLAAEWIVRKVHHLP